MPFSFCYNRNMRKILFYIFGGDDDVPQKRVTKKRTVKRRVKKRAKKHVVTKRSRAASPHYRKHKEAARKVIVARLEVLNAEHYGLTYGRVAIRNTKTRWGSCSSDGNLNFHYRLAFLPQELMDYVLIHELCHLQELNHSRAFWALVAQADPEHKAHRKALHEHNSV